MVSMSGANQDEIVPVKKWENKVSFSEQTFRFSHKKISVFEGSKGFPLTEILHIHKPTSISSHGKIISCKQLNK